MAAWGSVAVLIEVKNVTKQYGNFYAVRNINFEIKDGEIVGFLGRNGAGKSTTMNMITGFIEPTEGDVIVNGQNIYLHPKKVKSQIGYMPEGTPLYAADDGDITFASWGAGGGYTIVLKSNAAIMPPKIKR